MSKTAISKAEVIIERFSHLPSRQVINKIHKQCKITPNSAATYYYSLRASKSAKARKAGTAKVRKLLGKAHKG